MKTYQLEAMTKLFENVLETVVETRPRDNVILRGGWDVPQRVYWVFHLGVTGDVVDTYHWDVVGCFISDLFETSWRRTDETSSLRPLETWSRHTNKTSWRRTTETSWRRSTETSLGVSFETYLRWRWAVRLLVAGWVVFTEFTYLFQYIFS